MEITLKVPEQLGSPLPNREVLASEFLETCATDSYRNEGLTRHEVGQLLGLDRWQPDDSLLHRQAQRPLSAEDINRERASLRLK